MSKFFINENQINLGENEILILEKDVNHIKNVLRLAIGDRLEIGVLAQNYRNYLVEIKKINKKEIVCKIIKEIKISKETSISITVVQGIPKSDKMEWIIQKCTELGIKKFIPLELKNCVAKLEGADIQKKTLRWQKIAEAAAKQCQRDIVPIVFPKQKLQDFCSFIKDYDCVFVAYEKEDKNSLKEVLSNYKKVKNIAIVIGPEGGFDVNEIDELKQYGAITISLGKRILRTETAPIFLSSCIMYEFEGE